MASVYINKKHIDHVVIENTTGADLETNDFAVIAPYVGVVDADAKSGADVSLFVADKLELEANEFVDGEDTFATLFQTVYFDPATLTFSDTSTATYYPVGYLTQVKDSAGIIKFEKFRFTEVVGA